MEQGQKEGALTPWGVDGAHGAPWRPRGRDAGRAAVWRRYPVPGRHDAPVGGLIAAPMVNDGLADGRRAPKETLDKRSAAARDHPLACLRRSPRQHPSAWFGQRVEYLAPDPP